MKDRLATLILSFALILTGCTVHKPELVQVNTIDSLLAGVYDGAVTLGELKRYGNFGIGTFDRLDGEMMLYDGTVYQIRGDGKVYQPENGVTSPFASVVKFRPQQTFPLHDLSYAGMTAAIDEAAPNRNVFLAIAVTGEFKSMRTRSVPAQNKPYRPLAEVTKTQPEFEMHGVRGIVVGFRLPAYTKGINVPGYHLHFVSEDRQQGGHILAFELADGEVSIAPIHRFRMILPEDDDFAAADLDRDRSLELHEVESAK